MYSILLMLVIKSNTLIKEVVIELYIYFEVGHYRDILLEMMLARMIEQPNWESTSTLHEILEVVVCSRGVESVTRLQFSWCCRRP